MKLAILSLALLLSLQSLTPAAEDTLNATELAYHLGIRSWVSKAQLQGADYDLQVIRIKDGKEGSVIVAGTMHATDREFTRLAIVASLTSNVLTVSLQPEAGAKYSTDGLALLPLRVSVPLPSVIVPGDYVLGGDIPSDRLKSDDEKPIQLRIHDVNEGLLLRVTKKP